MRSCVASALECEGVVYFCVNVRDLVLFTIGSLVFLNAALKDVPTIICDSQLVAIEAVKAIFKMGKQ